jgi:hypothetical protein
MSDDENKHPFTDVEARLISHGGSKIVSLWWVDPYLIGVFEDGRSQILAEPRFIPSDPPVEQKPPESLVRQIREGVAECAECSIMGQGRTATTVAYCCGLKKWLPVCEEHAEEMGDGGPGDCP